MSNPFWPKQVHAKARPFFLIAQLLATIGFLATLFGGLIGLFSWWYFAANVVLVYASILTCRYLHNRNSAPKDKMTVSGPLFNSAHGTAEFNLFRTNKDEEE